MTKIDTQSAKIHDVAYRNEFELENSRKRIAEYDAIDLYTTNGFKEIMDDTKNSVRIHIDIGCGAGWLMIKTAPLFNRVVGIDPSSTAIDIAKEITKDIPHLEFINKDMVEALKSLNISEPVLLTTGVVLSHIEDYHVKAFLKELNTIPNNSVIYFDEPYGANIQQNMWHVRSKKWWADHLPEWDLTFKVRPNDVYSGIYGKKLVKRIVLSSTP